MSKAQSAPAQTDTCEECGGRLIADDVRGDRACEDCGLVVESDVIDPGPEWRCLDDSDATQRAGTLVDRTRDDNGFMTMIGRTDGPATSDYEGRLRRAQGHYGHGKSKKDRVLAKCLSDIKTLCGQIEAPDGVEDFACVLFKRFAKADDHNGYSYDPFIAAAIITAGRVRGGHVDREGLCSRLSVSEYLVFRRLHRFADTLDVGVPVRPAISYVPPVVDELGGSFETRRRAEEIAQTAEDAGLTNSGTAPSGYAAAAVYAAFSGSEADSHRSQKRVAEVSQASQPTIRNRCDELLEAGIITEEERHGY